MLTRVAAAVVAALLAVACGGGGEDKREDVPPPTDEAARAAIVDALLALPEQGTGSLRFSIRLPSTSVDGVADYDRRRFVSRLEIDRPEMQAAYDVAVIEGLRYEKLLRIRTPGRTPDFTPRWSSPEPWRPTTALPATPYLFVPFVGEVESDIRTRTTGFNDARRREVLAAVLVGFTNVGTDRLRDTSTVHYRLTLDRDKAKALLAAELARGFLSIPPSAPATQDVDVWIDHRGRIRRYVTSTLEVELWSHDKPPSVEVPGDLEVRAGPASPDPREQRLAEESALAGGDLAGYTPGAHAQVEAGPYASCWDQSGVLTQAGGDRTASAQSQTYGKGTTFIGSYVMLLRTAAESTAGHRQFEDPSMPHCFASSFERVATAAPGQQVTATKSEVVREPALGEQSITFRIDLTVGTADRRQAQSHQLLQVTVVRTGRGVALLFTATTGRPFPDEERRRLASLIAGRLPA